jgi:WD40 repeat protein
VYALSDGHRVLSASRDNALRVWDVNTGECSGLSDEIIFPDIYLDVTDLTPDRFIDLPSSQVWATHSLVVICHKIGDNITIPPVRSDWLKARPESADSKDRFSHCTTCIVPPTNTVLPPTIPTPPPPINIDSPILSTNILPPTILPPPHGFDIITLISSFTHPTIPPAETLPPTTENNSLLVAAFVSFTFYAMARCRS